LCAAQILKNYKQGIRSQIWQVCRTRPGNRGAPFVWRAGSRLLQRHDHNRRSIAEPSVTRIINTVAVIGCRARGPRKVERGPAAHYTDPLNARAFIYHWIGAVVLRNRVINRPGSLEGHSGRAVVILLVEKRSAISEPKTPRLCLGRRHHQSQSSDGDEHIFVVFHFLMLL
jgi:hypothetical protein